MKLVEVILEETLGRNDNFVDIKYDFKIINSIEEYMNLLPNYQWNILQ